MADGTCSVAGCERTGRLRRGWCEMHYARWYTKGTTDEPPSRKNFCSVDGCVRPVKAQMLCAGHYSRLLKTGKVRPEVPLNLSPADGTCVIRSCCNAPAADKHCREHADGISRCQHPDPAMRRKGRPCTVLDCPNKSLFRGWCSAHYNRWVRHFDVLAEIPLQKFDNSGPNCSKDGCSRPPYQRGLCRLHYQHHLRTGQVGLRPAPSAEEIEDRIAREREYHRRYKAAEYKRDSDRILAQQKLWAKAHPERMKLSDARKRKKRRTAKRIPYTIEQLADKVRHWGWKCWMCGDPWQVIDHVKPLSKGGWDALCNLRPACKWCNGFKHSRWPFPTTTRPEDYFAAA